MDKAIEDMKKHTDLNPWYWISYGEKCYAFAVVAAFPLKEGDPCPKYGTRLELRDYRGAAVWVGENGTLMLIDEKIADIERQNGDTICRFIAASHAHFLGSAMKELEKING